MSESQNAVRPDVINYEDVCRMMPALAPHKKFVERILRLIWMDRVNAVHGRYCRTPGMAFSHALVEKEFKIDLRVDNEDVLDRFADKPFITVSNHPFGGFDGILLTHIVGRHRPDYRVMVNMFLNHLSAMRSGFIAVDPQQTSDPSKRAVTMQGIREAIRHVRSGHPLGFFPAGAVSKINRALRIRDRKWQPSVLRLIAQLGVPVVPIYFHGRNSNVFNVLGVISWQLRTLRLPYEVFDKTEKRMQVSVGEPISAEKIASFGNDIDALGQHLRAATYAMSSLKEK